MFLDGSYREEGDALVWHATGHLQTREVGEVLEHPVARMARHVRRRGVLAEGDSDDDLCGEDAGVAQLAALFHLG